MGTGVINARSWIVNEDCEGTGTPSGWTVTSGTPNWDYSAAPLADAQSLYLSSAAAANRNRVDFTDQTEAWIYFLLRFTNGSGPAAGSVNMGGTSENGGVLAQNFVLGSNLRFTFAVASPATAIIVNTTYHVWLHYKQGSGANAVADIGFSTTGVRPTSGGTFAQVTNGGGTNLCGRLFIGPTTTALGVDMILDNIRVSSTQIGDNGS